MKKILQLIFFKIFPGLDSILVGREHVSTHEKVEFIRRNSVCGFEVDAGKTLREFR